MGKIILGIIWTLFLWFINWATLPVWNLTSGGFNFFLLVGFLGYGFILYDYYEEEFKLANIPLVGIALVLLNIIVFGWLASSNMFRSDEYHSMLDGKIQQKEYTNDIEPIAIDKVILIDDGVAARLGDKRLGEENEIVGSMVEIGSYTTQKVGDQVYYVAPLEHAGFFAYRRQPQGTPGYIKVNATNSSDVEYVREINGKPINIKYQPNAFFAEDLERHIRRAGIWDFITDMSFEIDDEGYPHYVVTKYNKTIGWSGYDAKGIVVVNAMNGEINEYDLDNVPQWVDRVHPIPFIEKQFNRHGRLVHGWWNPSNKDEIKGTNGFQIVYGSDDRIYYYSGVTSVGKDNSTIGFVLFDLKTKDAKLYRMAGATEYKAMASAEGLVQNLGYNSTFPRPYAIADELTYIMALKDNEGLIKKVAMVSVSNYEVAAEGNSIREAYRNYRNALSHAGANFVANSDLDLKTHTGKVVRINQDAKSGNYYILISGLKNNIFTVSSENSDEIVLTQVNDNVSVKYYNSDDGIITAVMFDNSLINILTTTEYDSVATKTIEFKEKKREQKVLKDIESQWKNMSDEEKKNMLDTRHNAKRKVISN